MPKRSALFILEGPDRGKVIPIEKLPFHIGRLTSNDLVLSDDQVSRTHVRLVEEGSDVAVMDLESRNGIFVNDKKVHRQRLKLEDRIQVGTTILLFRSQEQVEQGDPPPVEAHKAEEPTRVRDISRVAPPAGVDDTKLFRQTMALYRSSLPPKGIVSQLLDIVFQGFRPDRAQIIWEPEGRLEMARSRAEGKNCAVLPLAENWIQKASQGSGVQNVQVEDPSGKKSDRMALLAPLRAEGGVLGWLYCDRSADMEPFASREQENYQGLALLAGGLLERSLLLTTHRKLRQQIQMMEKYLTPEVSRMLSAKGISIEESALGVEEKEVTVLFSDIVGFTPMSERLGATELAALLNEYFQRMVDVITTNHGEVNKFIGDAIMALFGAPRSYGNDAANAVAAGLGMVEALKLFWREIDDKKRFNIRIGINTGKMVAGNIGSEKKMEYTVLGDDVNVASRIEGISPPNTVTVGAQTAQLIRDQFRLEVVSGVKVKGKSKTMNVFQVLGAA